jgi:hypothetical protein
MIVSTKDKKMIWKRLSAVPVGQTDFVWDPFLPAGAISILEGSPGSLKSTLCSDLAARVSSGTKMPEVIQGKTSAKPQKNGVILMAGEDDSSRIRMACEAAGADLDRIALIERCCLSENVSEVRAAAKDLSARLIVIDPITDFVQQRLTDERVTRDALTPLRKLAQDLNLSVVIVRHLVKTHRGGAVGAGLGSIALTGVARSVILAAPHPELPGAMVLSITKSNVSAPLALSYSVTGGIAEPLRIVWGSVVDGVDSNSLLRTADFDSRSALTEAVDFLFGLLKEAPVPTALVKCRAMKQGVSWSTIKRAKKHLGVRSFFRGTGRNQYWVYALPDCDNESMIAAKDRELNYLFEELRSGIPNSDAEPMGGTSVDTDPEEGAPTI